MSYTEDDNPIYVYTNHAAEWNTGTPLTLITYSGSPGVVESIQFAETTRNFNALLNITIDGGSTKTFSEPAFLGFSLDPWSSIVTGKITGVYGFNPHILGGINNKNYIGQCAHLWGCTKRVFIPFQNSITITVSGNDQYSTVFSQVVYRKWPTIFPNYFSIGTRRKFWGVVQDGTWGTPISLSAYSNFKTTEILGIGQIEFITHVLWGVTKAVSGDTGCNPMSCLEGEYTLIIDGETRLYSTTDNFFGGQHYWQNGTTEINGSDCGLFTYLGTPWQGDFNMHAYKFCYDKPIFFNSSFQLSWNYGKNGRSQFGQGVTNCSNIFLVSYWLNSSS